MSAKRYEALVDDILKRLAPFAKPLSGVAEVKDPLDNGLKWLHRWLKGLKTAQFKINDQMMNDFAKSLHYVAFGWTVQHPKLFSSSADKQFLHAHKNEKDKIEAMIYAAQQLLPFFVYQATAETFSSDQKSGAKATASSMSASAADAAASRDPLGGWQGALLGLLEGLHAHLETRNPASSTSTQDDMSAYRDYVGMQLLEPLVKVVFPTQTATTLPAGPGDPIKDYKGRTIFAPEIKYAAVDVIVESLRRQVTPLIKLRNVLPLAYDMHLSSALIDLAYRLLPGRRQQKVTGEASVRSKAIDRLFSDDRFGIAEAGKLRALVETLDTKDWFVTSNSLLAEISILHIKRGQAFVTNDFCYNGEHLLPVQPGKEGPHSKSLTEETLLAGTAFVATSVWFGRDSLTVLIDEPPECTKARAMEEKMTMDVRPSGQPTETRDARARVPYSAIRKIHVRPVASADDGYRVILLLDKPLQIDGRPYKAKASHYGTDIASDAMLAAFAPSGDAFHKLELVLNSKRVNLALLKKVLEERKQRYPNLGDELDSFPAIAATVRSGSGAAPAPKPAAKLQAKGHTAANGTAEIVKGGAAVAQTRTGVPKAPRKSSQANPIEFSGSGEESAEDAQVEPGDGEGNAVQDGKGEGDADLECRRDKLADMARVGSPSTSATSSRRRSKDDNDAETGDLGNLDQDRDFGGGFEDEEAREAALNAKMKEPAGRQTDEEDMPAPHSIGRPRSKSASPEEDDVDQLDEDQHAVETAEPEKKKQDQPAAKNKAGAAAPRAKPSRQAGSPPPHASPPLRRSPRLSPPPPKPKGSKGTAARDEGNSGSEEQTRSRQRGGAAAAGKKKQVVQPTAKQKRPRPENDDDDDEALTSLEESSDADDEDFVDTSKKKKSVVQPSKSAAPASKRRKVSDQQSEKEDETDYDEPATLPKKVSRPPVKHKFGKEVGKAPRSNGTTRKANQPPVRTTARKAAGATASDKPASKSTSKSRSKTDKKPPSKPASKSAPRSRVSMSDSASEEADEQSRAGQGGVPRAIAKKVGPPAAKKTVLPNKGGDKEDEEPLPKKKGDKRVADDIPPPADLTASEQSRVNRAAPKSPAKSPGKAKPVQTLDQLTGDAPVPAVDTVAAGDPMEDVDEGAEEQQEIFEADFVMEDVNLEEIAAVFGPDSHQAGTAAKPADDSETFKKGNEPSATHVKNAEPARQDSPERDRLSAAPASVSALKAIAPVPAGPPASKDATTKQQDRAGSGPASPKAGIAEEEIARSPAEKGLRQAPPGNDASTSIIAPADSSSCVQQNAPIKPNSEQLPKVTLDTSDADTSRGRPTAPHEDSGVQFVANTSAVRQKEAPAADSLHRLAESMDVADEEPTTISEEPTRRSERLPISAAKAAGNSSGSTPHRAPVNASSSAPTTGQRVAYAPTPNAGRPDLPPSQSTPAQQGVPKGPPAFSLPWSAIPTRTTALRQGKSRATKPPIPTEVRKQAQLATGSTGLQQRTPAHPPAKSARNVARASQPAFYIRPYQQPAHASPGDGRIRTKPDKIVLQERPTDIYEQFFELLVDLGGALVSKQREVAAHLQQRREIGKEKIEKLVTRSVQSDHAQTRNIANMVAHRAGGVDDDGVSASVQACAIEVADHNAQLGDEVRELLNKLAAEKLA
ncbi:hypothetical protein JCM10908_003318 [Rhodotorula pacifica]|uniref:uncharacterized protein n=1 Tax=Rhodotorula pacifica TaxID=1495444 RepID=UPI003173915C